MKRRGKDGIKKNRTIVLRRMTAVKSEHIGPRGLDFGLRTGRKAEKPEDLIYRD